MKNENNATSTVAKFSPGRIEVQRPWRDDDILTINDMIARIETTQGKRWGASTLRAECAAGRLIASQPGGCGVWLATWGNVKRWMNTTKRSPKAKIASSCDLTS